MRLSILCFTGATLIITHCGVLPAVEALDYKGQFSSEFLRVSTSDSQQNLIGLRYIPDLTKRGTLSADLTWDFNLSANLYANYQNQRDDHYYHETKFYRANLRFKTLQSDTQMGLQQINFGPALLLRSLRWFDQVNPTDPLKLTQGVKGLRYRYFFPNNANVWLWGLYANKDPKGYERVASKAYTPELGARYQFPQGPGELGLSLHARKTERMGFSADDLGHDLIEKRYAIDGKWDIGPGVWFEYVDVDQGANTADNNWFSMLTLGSDYTFAYGNGVTVVLEHLLSAESDKPLTWNRSTQTSAMQLSYPLNILDALSLLFYYSWEQQQAFEFARWNRTYDNWSISAGVFTSSGDASLASSSIYGDGVQVLLVFNH